MNKRWAHVAFAKSTIQTKAAYDEFREWRDAKIRREYIKRIGLPRFVISRMLHLISYHIVWPQWSSRDDWRCKLGRKLNRLSVRVTYPDAEQYRRIFGNREGIEGKHDGSDF